MPINIQANNTERNDIILIRNDFFGKKRWIESALLWNKKNFGKKLSLIAATRKSFVEQKNQLMKKIKPNQQNQEKPDNSVYIEGLVRSYWGWTTINSIWEIEYGKDDNNRHSLSPRERADWNRNM